MSDNKPKSLSGSVSNMIDRRVQQLESDSASTRQKLDAMADTQTEISKAIVSLAASSEITAATLEKVNTTMERSRDFEVRTETERKAERDHRDRLDRRVDDMQRDVINSRKDFDEGLDRAHSHIRKDINKLDDRLRQVDKDHTESFNSLGTKVAVKTGVDDVQNKNTRKIVDVRGDRIAKLLLWFITAIGGIVLFNTFKGG